MPLSLPGAVVSRWRWQTLHSCWWIGTPTPPVMATETSEIISEERPKVDHEKNFEQAMNEVESGVDRRAEAFEKAFKKTQNLDDLLQKKFEEARKKAEKDPNKKHRNPLDFD